MVHISIVLILPRFFPALLSHFCRYFICSRWTTKKENGDDDEEEPDADEIEAMLERAEEDSDDDEQVQHSRDVYIFFYSLTGKKDKVGNEENFGCVAIFS